MTDDPTSDFTAWLRARAAGYGRSQTPFGPAEVLHMAADHIEALEAEIAALRAQQASLTSPESTPHMAAYEKESTMTENEKRLDEAVKALEKAFHNWAYNYTYDSRPREQVSRDTLRPFFADPAPRDASGCVEVLRDILRAYDHPAANYDPVRYALFDRARMALAAWDARAKPAAPAPNADLVKKLHRAADSSSTLSIAQAFRALAEHFAGIKR